MLTLQQQHLPVTSPTFFSAPSSSPPVTPNQPSSPFPMAESIVSQHRARRSSRSPLNPGSSTPPSTSSSYTTFPKYLSVDLPSASLQNMPVLPSTGSRLKFGENWNEQDTNGAFNLVPESLLSSSLRVGRFISTFRTNPTVLAAVIAFLHGSYELLNFCHVSKQMKELVEGFFDNNDQVRDAFLTRSISGYQPSASPKASWLNRALRIDLTDMELLLESNSVSLAMYPTHSLRVIASPQSSMSSADAGENDNTTARFQTLTLTHSRFVAYLRSRTAPQALQLASQDEDDVMLPSPDSSGSPELVFPNPLFYFKDVEPAVTPAYLPLPPSPTTTRSKAKSISGTAPTLSKSKSTSNFRSSDADVSEHGKGSIRLKRLSMKPRRKSNAKPPPPPSAIPAMPVATSAPFDMGQFGSLGPPSGHGVSQSFHERSKSQGQISTAPLPHTISHSHQSSYSGYTPPPPTGQFTPPSSSSGWQTPPPPIIFGGKSTPPPPPPSISRWRRARQNFHMSESSSGSFAPSQFFSRSMPFLPGLPFNGSPGVTTRINALDTTLTPSSPGDIHSLSQVFRLTRAPIFRVFVPCSRLDRSIRHACMAQLHAASLVPHLRAGDLVCNLGYVPDLGADDLSSGNGAPENDDSGDCRGWMVFTGHELCPLTTRAAIPVRDPTFILTTPHYYSHVLLAEENPRFGMTIPLIPPEKSQGYVFSLMRDTRPILAAVKKSGGGEAGGSPRKHKVSRFVWVACVECARWGSEWMIEAEGTKEGREFIENALQESLEGLEREWELVRDRTGRGRVYVRRI